MNINKAWMYARLDNGFITEEYMNGVEDFVNFAKSHPECMSGDKLRCPCAQRKCRNTIFHDEDTVKVHLGKYGFIPNYYNWYVHGEPYITDPIGHSNLPSSSPIAQEDPPNENAMQSMIQDAMNAFHHSDVDEIPTPAAKKLYEMLQASEREVWEGIPSGHSQLSAVARLLNIKAEHHFSERCYDDLCQLISELLPTDNIMTDNFYNTKKLVKGLGLPVEKIDCCINNCMIFWKDDIELTKCKMCGHPRYRPQKRGTRKNKKDISFKIMYYFPLTRRLQRLYASTTTAKHMRWHHEHVHGGDAMCHPSDSVAWKHLDEKYPSFAKESRNVRLGLSADGFQPFGQSGKQYSSWPIILTPYNLPPWMCMKDQYMFLTVLVPGPKNPKEKIDVFMQPLIAELKDLWSIGVETYDIVSKTNFKLHAALLWTISDFPAYSMLSGWSTAGKLACPHCMDESDAFTLPRSGKTSWFDNHRKFLSHDHPFRRNKKSFAKNREVTKHPPQIKSGEEIIEEIESYELVLVTEIGSDELNKEIVKMCKCGWRKKRIFWELPYWKDLLIRHNLDVMHVEKNFFDNIFNTVMNVSGRTKDTSKSREELKEWCCKPELHQDETSKKFPKACYTLKKESKQALCSWLKDIKFSDGYASNMSRCVDMNKLKIFGMKSHDCHVFMQRLIPIAFHDLLPNNVWQALTELSMFFRDLTSRVITTADMVRLETIIPLVLCKLERIFPPSFFDSMEHLPIHLAYEARLAGPVQYRWMYPFERFLRRLKNNIRNKAKVEGSICNAYLVEETSSFCAYYFADSVKTRHRKFSRNSDDARQIDTNLFSIFKFPGRPIGSYIFRWLDDREYHAARTYILLNCDEVKPFISMYEQELRKENPAIRPDEEDKQLDTNFASWFESHVKDPNSNVHDEMIKDFASGPLRNTRVYSGYYVNGFKFHVALHIIMVDIAEEEVGDRIELRVVGNNFVPHGHRVSAYITSKFKLRQYASGHTWGHLDEDGKDF
ncbi:uncharacterized protein [Primulina huaijiensis]|uniref:uncharacterized protein isoform X2 n=1 Tax=Primulina huaijiensis TaxID=1492673 RepID=UPI003CC792B1